MNEEIEILKKQISKQDERILKHNKLIDHCFELIASQNEQIHALSKRISANSTIVESFFPVLIQTIPILLPLFRELIDNILKQNESMKTKKDVEPNVFLKAELSTILKRLTSPPKYRGFRLVENDK